MINPSPVSIALVIPRKGGKPTQIATGFFFTHNRQIYLITNKHVIFKKDESSGDFIEPNADELLVSLNGDSIATAKSGRFRLLLNDGSDKEIWLMDIANPETDVIVIPCEIDKSVIIPVTEAFIKLDAFPQGSEIVTFGYPSSAFDANFTKLDPSSASGTLMSEFLVPIKNRPLMLGDMKTAEGMSGSPVFDKDGERLIGIHSGELRVKATNEWLGANIWFPDLITKIILKK